MKSIKSYVSDINKKIEELHEKHGIPYRVLPKRITAKEVKEWTREGLQALRKEVYSPDAYHVTWKDGKSVTTPLKEKAKEIIDIGPGKTKTIKSINRQLSKLSKKVSHDITLPEPINMKDAKDYEIEFLKAAEASLKAANASDIYELADKTKVAGFELNLVQEMTKAGNIQRKKLKDILKQKQKEDINKHKGEDYTPIQVGSLKESELNPREIISTEDLLKKDMESLYRALDASMNRANLTQEVNLLKENLHKALMRSNGDVNKRMQIAEKISRMPKKDLLKVFYTSDKLDFSYIYNDLAADSRIDALMEELKIKGKNYEISDSHKQKYLELIDEFNSDGNIKLRAEERYNKVHWNTKNIAERHTDKTK